MLRLIKSRSQSAKLPVMQDSVDEHDLLQKIINRDTRAFEAFYKHYYPKLFRFILRTTRRTEHVEELIQETMILVWEQPERYNHDSKISTWVFGIAYMKALKSLSKSGRCDDYLDIDELSETLKDPLANLAQNMENQNWLNSALENLSVDQRALIELTFYHGLTYQEIAKILDCPENTVKTRMFHARKKLQAFAETQEN